MPEVAKLWLGLRQTARLMVGIPDYDAYVAHRACHHPDQAVMSYEEFFRRSQERRYNGGCGKCC